MWHTDPLLAAEGFLKLQVKFQVGKFVYLPNIGTLDGPGTDLPSALKLVPNA
jgi:hypothetical protein